MKDAVEPFLKGGGQEKGMRSGTENVFGALAFAKCLEKFPKCIYNIGETKGKKLWL